MIRLDVFQRKREKKERWITINFILMKRQTLPSSQLCKFRMRWRGDVSLSLVPQPICFSSQSGTLSSLPPKRLHLSLETPQNKSKHLKDEPFLADWQLYTYPHGSVRESLPLQNLDAKSDFWALRPFRYLIRVMPGQKTKNQSTKRPKREFHIVISGKFCTLVMFWCQSQSCQKWQNAKGMERHIIFMLLPLTVLKDAQKIVIIIIARTIQHNAAV